MPFPLFSLLGLGSLFTAGPLSNVLAGATTAKNVWDQYNFDPTNLSLDEQVRRRAELLVPTPLRGLLPEKPTPSGGGGVGGGGGGGGDGSGRGTDILGRPFFDPGFGSPAQNLQFGGDPGFGGAGVPAVTTQPLAPPAALPGIPEEADFSAGFDFGTDFGFNQGGIVSLLPRRATPVRSPPISYRRY